VLLLADDARRVERRHRSGGRCHGLISGSHVCPLDVQQIRGGEQLERKLGLLGQAARVGLRAPVSWVSTTARSRRSRPQPTGVADIDEACELGFSLLWRFGSTGQTARIAWQIRLDAAGVDRTVLSIAIHARAGDHEAGKRISAAWPIVETITLQHAKGLRRAPDEYAADSCAVDRLRTPAAFRAAA
jgi:hypothetical protein